MSTATHIAPVFASVNTVKPKTQKNFLRSCPEVVHYLLQKFANNQTITEMDSAILGYTKPANITPIQYADDLYDKSYKVGYIYDESTLSDIFIEEFDFSICHNLQE